MARCGIAHREEFVGEATEIMDRRRMGRRGNRRAAASMRGVVMRRHDQDGARARQAGAQPGEEIPRRTGFERHHRRSEEHTSELQSLMRISYAVFCLKKKKTTQL